MATVLVVGKPEEGAPDLAAALVRRGYLPIVADGAERALQILRGQSVAAIVVALPIEGESSKALVARLREHDPSVIFIVIGLDDDIRSAADAFDLGAYDYIDRTG